MSISQRIADELSIRINQVDAVVGLLDEGATVPFIARYRKEVTGGLDDTQLRHLVERLGYLNELEERREAVLKSVQEQGKLTDQLKASLLAADTKTRLEDLYLPYKPKRRTKAQIAREAGLGPLAEALLNDPGLQPQQEAQAYLNEERGVADSDAALDGAKQILMEQFAEDAELVGRLREHLWESAELTSKLVEGKEKEGAKFSDYFDYAETINKIPSHRALALFRGRQEGILSLELVLPEDEGLKAAEMGVAERMIARQMGVHDEGRPADDWLQGVVRWAWRIKIFTHLDNNLKTRLREAAEEEAIKVFARNLHDLLLASPAGPRATIGLDPGLRTGVKIAVIDSTGKVVETATIYPHVPKKRWQESLKTLADLAAKFKVELVSIGNGTASRETDRLVADLIKQHPQLRLTKVMVSEAGASVYSASEFAAQEFPEMDVSLRGAVSIARRLQDPLAELVKIEPKSIGVGQYQHDVSQSRLARQLDAVVEDCVNAVGVDINTASAPLLNRVAGLSTLMADNVVKFRDQHGAFADRKAILKVPRIGEKAFEQCAGFLRIMNGTNPLDASAVHPEAYPVVQRILAKTGREMSALIGDSPFLKKLSAKDFTDETFGQPTVEDIIRELEKPGRDPRPEFKTATFKEGVENLQDLKSGMILEGVVTNVTNFGAFVDIGVHQDGLVHISALSDKFVKDTREVVKAGDLVKVKVMDVDIPRKRIALSMRLTDEADASRSERSKNNRSEKRQHNTPSAKKRSSQAPKGAMAAAFAKLGKV
ncbi:MAG: RNA-binding transcriptional accessory protein [Candidatus Thiodiazotropha sp. (ex. Lucinisca nassula)]|nr:RNA-binding transcriptional accessory protein [Candidatus Thiodiazotropha sp. (ex. Lucinisca nassula)]MBW9263136.1 RNA-binding transcriptional accessory protein [Candidatus Thiodiazotropha sp. (ex. Lucinisca nassula)]MBW9270674.1 RNA-binding transcriptional accessory protein [Candidatus Thiodiazotropha sp. (ex. Lucinisca nassula)]